MIDVIILVTGKKRYGWHLFDKCDSRGGYKMSDEEGLKSRRREKLAHTTRCKTVDGGAEIPRKRRTRDANTRDTFRHPVTFLTHITHDLLY